MNSITNQPTTRELRQASISNPHIAKAIAYLITPKQQGICNAEARRAGVDVNAESQKLYNCEMRFLSGTVGKRFIAHLEMLPNAAPEPIEAQPLVVPVGEDAHGDYCYSVAGSNGFYTVRQRNTAYRCECKGFMRWQHCKHVNAVTAFEQHNVQPEPQRDREAESAVLGLKSGARMNTATFIAGARFFGI